ncbi:MAG: gliding motility lipoprotein GldD [Bacteroidales bacterium]|nr:gliding motility lipoprotein GldD [Bacteroidales bacterium]
MKNKIIDHRIFLVFLVFVALFFTACNNDYQPKPRAYFRINMPEKDYKLAKTDDLPYFFHLPAYAHIKPIIQHNEKHWINIQYPAFDAQLHISYKAINNNLDTLLNDMHKMMSKHIPKANAINEQMYLNDDRKVYGMTYEIKGSEAASPFQFYLTDSIHHFVRGALYFNFSPNNDSLKPIIERLEEDVQVLIETFQWEE